MKVCSKCDIEKEDSFFNKGRNDCKACRKLYMENIERGPTITKNTTQEIQKNTEPEDLDIITKTRTIQRLSLSGERIN